MGVITVYIGNHNDVLVNEIAQCWGRGTAQILTHGAESLQRWELHVDNALQIPLLKGPLEQWPRCTHKISGCM